MPQRNVNIPGVGEVLISKRRKSSSLRLTVTNTGKIRVGIPYWTPYAAGAAFAKSRADWIARQVAVHRQPILKPGDRIGKTYRLHFYQVRSPNLVRTRVSDSKVEITSNLLYENTVVQAKAYQACERALKKEAQVLLPPRLSLLANQYRFKYQAVRIKKLASRWGSCSDGGTITLSYYLVQLPWHLIDYVLIHELVHTKHLHHGKDFWSHLEKLLPAARQLRKEIHSHKSRVEPA